MCGIFGYIGKKEAYELLVKGLEQLEYRGYDSAGVCVSNEELEVHKVKGRVAQLYDSELQGSIGIAHTRWSTHGIPSVENAHPFVDAKKEFAIVHNGIIENYLELKEELRKDNVSFSSDTDSEVIVHLVAKYYQGNLLEAVQKVVSRLQGAYAFCVLFKGSKEIVGARNGSPLVLGLGEGENFFASDVAAVIEYTKRVVYLNDFEVARISEENVEVFDFDGLSKEFVVSEVSWDIERAQKQGYKHFMLKEVFEQPKVIEDCLKIDVNFPKEVKKIIILACGTAMYAGHVGKYIIEKIARIPVEVEIASEFRYRDPLVSKDDVVMVISQSGETADSLAAMRIAKEKGARTFGIINVVDSTIARECDNVMYTRAGPEIGVASTKAFMAQLVVLYKIAYYLAGKDFVELKEELLDAVKRVLGNDAEIREVAEKYSLAQNMLYVGRNQNFPLALEGALKLKEISYIHAEGYPAGELKHGPIALVSEEMPVVAICPKDTSYGKTLSNIEEIKARHGKVVGICTFGDSRMKDLCEDVIYVPEASEVLYPFVLAIPLQLFAYHIADLRECDVDKPRNLAKSVTVE